MDFISDKTILGQDDYPQPPPLFNDRTITDRTICLTSGLYSLVFYHSALNYFAFNRPVCNRPVYLSFAFNRPAFESFICDNLYQDGT